MSDLLIEEIRLLRSAIDGLREQVSALYLGPINPWIPIDFSPKNGTWLDMKGHWAGQSKQFAVATRCRWDYAKCFPGWVDETGEEFFPTHFRTDLNA